MFTPQFTHRNQYCLIMGSVLCQLRCDLAAASLVALWRLSMSEVRMERTSRRISGSSIRVKDSRGSKKDEGSAVNRLLLSYRSDTWGSEEGRDRRQKSLDCENIKVLWKKSVFGNMCTRVSKGWRNTTTWEQNKVSYRGSLMCSLLGKLVVQSVVWYVNIVVGVQ